MAVHVLDHLAPTQDVKIERAIEVHPSIRLLWAHFTIHIHDELLLVMQVHTPLVDNLDPLPILR
jgi:hypothetical protein